MFHIAPLAVEFCLAHKLRDRVEAGDLRTDLLAKRRDIMEEWGDYAGCLPRTNSHEQRVGLL